MIPPQWRLAPLFLLCLACVPKTPDTSLTADPPTTTTPVIQEPAPPPPEPEPVFIETQQEEPPLIQEAEESPEVIIEPPDPEELLESALELYDAAQERWKAGEPDTALLDLDNAFALILQVDVDSHPDLLQQREDLRYLLSKRVVEIHASRRTSVGETSKSIQLDTNQYVEREIKSFQTRERKYFLEAYKKSGRYRPMIVEKLREQGLPEQLSWLPLIESYFKTNALSRARALGMWQFIPSTGYRYGMSRDQWVDERMDPVKSTDAAIAYLTDLHGLFGDWLTALAGYNCGEGRVLRAIKRQPINYLDHFWDLYEMLPRETARYVPRFIATLMIIEDPEKYGFELPEVDPPMDFQMLEVERSVKLTELDKLAGVEQGTFKQLNPELRFGVTPNKAYPLRVPSAALASVTDGIAKLPQWEVPEDAYVTHVVRRGETLSTIASRYRTTTRKIVLANRLPSANRIWPGQKIKVPGRSFDPRALATKVEAGPGKTHRVVRGDSLWKIAKQYGVTINQLKAWNNLSSNRLKQGQRLKVSSAGTTQQASNSNGSKTYRVRRGDTLDKIARRHGVTLTALLRANNLNKSSVIYPRQKLVVPES